MAMIDHDLSGVLGMSRSDEIVMIDSIIANIAREKLNIDILETRHHNSLDFRDISVWNLRDALTDAFEAGRRFDQ
jgi:Family of unknown function (DUF6900)